MWLMVIVVAIMSWLVGKIVSQPVEYMRFVRFANQIGLYAIPDDFELVRRYLEVTRRWRAIGVGAALCFTLAEGLRRNAINVDLYLVLSGWFAGAVFAEWRLNLRPSGDKRRASLLSRRQARYLSPVHRAMPWVAAVLAFSVGGVSIVKGEAVTQNVVLLGWVVAVMVAIAAVGRQVLERPQPADADPLFQQVDNALRAKSLAVLSGSATALVVTSLAGVIYVSAHGWEVFAVVLILLSPVIGWLMATNTRARQVAVALA